MVQPGTILAGKYQVERILGQGGMGCVVAALHLQLGQRVAIKFLVPEALRNPEVVERFLREARASVRLRSEHVGRVIDVGQFDDGAPYLVMEYLDGLDLAQYLHRHGPAPVSHAVDFVLQAAEAIAEAHALGIVHRDLKPANLFLTRAADGSPLVKVLDFGISKAHHADAAFHLTRTTTVMGSPGYMAPEQLRSAKDCDARTDIWALGVILYELTVGRLPFGAESITELALRVAMDPTPPMNLAGAPPGFEEAVGRALAKAPAQRYPNVAELAAALVPFGPPGAMDRAMRIARVLQVSPSAMAARGPEPSAGGRGKPTTLSSAVGETVAPRRRAGVIAGIAVGVALAGGAVAALVLGGGKRAPEAATPTTQAPAPDAGVAATVAPDAAAAPAATPPDAGAEVVAAPPDAGPSTRPPSTRPPHKKPAGKKRHGDTGDTDVSTSRF